MIDDRIYRIKEDFLQDVREGARLEFIRSKELVEKLFKEIVNDKTLSVFQKILRIAEINDVLSSMEKINI